MPVKSAISRPILNAGGVTGTGQSIIFSNANGVSFGLSNSSVITASISVTGGGGSGIQGIAAGTQTGTTNTIVFSNSNGISFGMDSSSIVTASYTVPSALGGIAVSGSTVTNGTVVLSNLNGISFGLGTGASSTVISASYTVPTQSTQPGIQSISAGSTKITTGEAVFSNSNNISFGISGGTITASASYSQSTSPSAIIASGGTITSGSISFENTNSISFGITGNTITASYAPVTSGIQAVVVGTNSLSAGSVEFVNSNGLSFGLSASKVTASYTVPTQSTQPGIQSISAGSTKATTGEIVFSNSNNISFGLDGQTLTASASYPSETPFALYAGSQSVSTGTVQFSNSNNISFGMSGNSIITASASYSNPVVSNAIQAIGSISSAGTNTSRFAADDHVHAGINSVSVAGNTAGTVTAGAGSLVLAGGKNITLSGSTSGGGMTLSVVGNALSGSVWANGSSNTTMTGSRAVASFQRVFIPFNMTATRMDLIFRASGTVASQSQLAASISVSLGVYDITGSTLSIKNNGTASSFASRTLSWASSNHSQNTGFRLLSVPLDSFSFSPGEYALGVNIDGTWGSSNVGFSPTVVGAFPPAMNFAYFVDFGITATTQNQTDYFIGGIYGTYFTYSSNASNTWTLLNSYNWTQITQNAGYVYPDFMKQPYIILIGS